MLEEREYLADENLKHIKLSSGIDVFGYVLPADDETSVVIALPMQVVELYDGQQMGSSLTRLMPYCDDIENQVCISTFHILAVTGVTSEVAEFYKLSSYIADDQQKHHSKTLKKTNEGLANAIAYDLEPDDRINAPYSYQVN